MTERPGLNMDELEKFAKRVKETPNRKEETLLAKQMLEAAKRILVTTVLTDQNILEALVVMTSRTPFSSIPIEHRDFDQEDLYVNNTPYAMLGKSREGQYNVTMKVENEKWIILYDKVPERGNLR